ncbi:MAG TPA: methyltransferase [Chloroflexia bacterium]
MIPLDLIREVTQVAGLAPGARVLEIGAGTGQLTAALRALRLRVVALEPGAHMRNLLRARFPSDANLNVQAGFFEDYRVGGAFDAIAAANAFHWLDPAVSYHKAADLLVGNGALVLIWNYAILDAPVQRLLNTQVFAGAYPDFVSDPDTFLAEVEANAVAGRAELAASGRFAEPWWQFTVEHFTLDVARYTGLLISYANGAARDVPARRELADRIHAALAAAGIEQLAMINYLYALVARKADA